MGFWADLAGRKKPKRAVIRKYKLHTHKIDYRGKSGNISYVKIKGKPYVMMGFDKSKDEVLKAKRYYQNTVRMKGLKVVKTSRGYTLVNPKSKYLQIIKRKR